MTKNLERAAFEFAALAKRANISNEEFDAVLIFKTERDLGRLKAKLMYDLDHDLITPEQRMVLWDRGQITIAGVTFKLRHQEVRVGHIDGDPVVAVERARDALNFRGAVHDVASTLSRALTELVILVNNGGVA